MGNTDNKQSTSFPDIFAEERANNPKYARGEKWGKVCASLWFVSAFALMPLPLMILLVIDGGSSDAGFYVLGILFSLVMSSSPPILAFCGMTRESRSSMSIWTAMCALFIFGSGISLIEMRVLVVLMMVLTAVMFLHPSIRHQGARHKELFEQCVAEAESSQCPRYNTPPEVTRVTSYGGN